MSKGLAIVPLIKTLQQNPMVAGHAITEASGRITLDTVAEIAATGVDLISVGWLTHSAPVLDIGLDYAALASGE